MGAEGEAAGQLSGRSPPPPGCGPAPDSPKEDQLRLCSVNVCGMKWQSWVLWFVGGSGRRPPIVKTGLFLERWIVK